MAEKETKAKAKEPAVTVDENGKRHYSKAERERRRKLRQEMAQLLHPELKGEFK